MVNALGWRIIQLFSMEIEVFKNLNPFVMDKTSCLIVGYFLQGVGILFSVFYLGDLMLHARLIFGADGMGDALRSWALLLGCAAWILANLLCAAGIPTAFNLRRGAPLALMFFGAGAALIGIIPFAGVEELRVGGATRILPGWEWINIGLLLLVGGSCVLRFVTLRKS